MPADVDSAIYLRRCEIGRRCQSRPGRVFAMTGSEILLSLGYEQCDARLRHCAQSHPARLTSAYSNCLSL